jgi:hypothetical protein
LAFGGRFSLDRKSNLTFRSWQNGHRKEAVHRSRNGDDGEASLYPQDSQVISTNPD